MDVLLAQIHVMLTAYEKYAFSQQQVTLLERRVNRQMIPFDFFLFPFMQKIGERKRNNTYYIYIHILYIYK